MSRNSGVVHHALPSHTRVLQREKLVDFLQIQKFDQLLAHQYCVRRFSHHYPKAFCVLKTIRSQIEAVLTNAGLSNKEDFFVARRVTVTSECMQAIDSRQAKSLAEVGDRRKFREFLEKEIEPDPRKLKPTRLGLLSDSDVERIVEILIRGCAAIRRIGKYFNFLDYYDPFALTDIVSGQTLMTHYLSTIHDLHSLKPVAEILGRDHRWLHTKEVELDEEMAGIIFENSFMTKIAPSNVRIFGHDKHSIHINDKELENHLILAVPTDKTPTQIDAALRDFRSVLMQAFIDKRGCYANVSSPEFDNSLFMRNFDDQVFLVRETKQYRSRLHGLWMWDLVTPSKNSTGLTVNKAMDKIEEHLRKIAPSETSYGYDANRNYYDQAVKQISPRSKNRQAAAKARDLDRYLTSGTAILGRRP